MPEKSHHPPSFYSKKVFLHFYMNHLNINHFHRTMQTECPRTKLNEHKMSQDFVLDTSWLTMSTGKKLQILLRPADHYKMKGVMNFNMISFQVRTQIPVVKDQTTFRLNIQVGAWEIILARESFKNDKNDLKLTKNITFHSSIDLCTE